VIFLTVGTQFPFDRLVKAVDSEVETCKIKEKIYAQIGFNSYQPKNFEAISSLEKNLFDKYFHHASSVISHAGMGTITMALAHNKPLLVMPRLKKYGEVINDHQLALSKKLEEFNHILVAYNEKELSEKIEQLKIFIPQKRIAQPQTVAAYISNFLNQLCV